MPPWLPPRAAARRSAGAERAERLCRGCPQESGHELIHEWVSFAVQTLQLCHGAKEQLGMLPIGSQLSELLLAISEYDSHAYFTRAPLRSRMCPRITRGRLTPHRALQERLWPPW